MVLIYVTSMAVSLCILWYAVRIITRRLQTTQWFSHGIYVRGTEILSGEQLHGTLVNFVVLLGLFGASILIYLFLGLIFKTSPATEHIGSAIHNDLIRRSRNLGKGILGAIPSIIQIIFIILIAKVISQIFSFLMLQVDRGSINLGQIIPRELARPVMYIGNFLITIVTLAVVTPKIPGLSSQGQLLILGAGAIVTLASSTTLSNVISGFVLAYMRPFKLGDAIIMNEIYGVVEERTLLYTKIRTPKNEEILFPNQQVASSQITNVSMSNEGLIVHTSVTIGYNVPRKQVEELLLKAAREVEYRAQDHDPFVWILVLGDFSVKYEINLYTRDTTKLPWILSQLHEYIKDSFEAANVEILSPNYYAIRDGNKSTVPEQNSES